MIGSSGSAASYPRYATGDHVLTQSVGSETVLLDLESGTYFSLDSVGSDIWAQLQAGQDLGEIVETMIERYEVDRDRATADVEQLLESLVERGLVIEV